MNQRSLLAALMLTTVALLRVRPPPRNPTWPWKRVINAMSVMSIPRAAACVMTLG